MGGRAVLHRMLRHRWATHPASRRRNRDAGLRQMDLPELWSADGPGRILNANEGPRFCKELMDDAPRPIYQTRTPGEPILLYDGPLVINDVGVRLEVKGQ